MSSLSSPPGVCQVDKQNRAGYSPIMLTALATLKTQDDLETVLQLFRLGNVNAKASQVQALHTVDPGSPSCSLSPGCAPGPHVILFRALGENPRSTDKGAKAQKGTHFLTARLEQVGLEL